MRIRLKERIDIISEKKPELFALIARLPSPLRKAAYIGVVTGAIGLVLAACDEDNTPPDGQGEPNEPTAEGLNFQLPVYSQDISEPWYLTGGPHSDGLSAGVRYAVDFASKEVRPCPASEPDLLHFAAAAEDGEVIIPSNDEEINKKNHSVVEIRHADGTITGYMHLANIQVEFGQQIEEGDILGNLSCESPPGGRTEGQHVHFYRKGPDGKPIVIEGMVLSGWQITESPTNYNGTMEKPGEDVRTAERARCGPDKDSIKDCGDIRNDFYVGRVLGTTVGTPPPTPNATETLAACREVAEVGCPAPDLTLKTSDGQMVKLSDYKGKPTILLLHANWCGPCKRELDTLLSYKVQYPELQILTITDAANNLIIQDVAEKTKPVFFWDYTSGPDSMDGKYRPVSLPSTYYIDSNWIVQGIYPGLRINKAMARDVSDLVAGRLVFRPPQFESREPFSFPRPSSGIYDIQELGGMAVIAFKFDQQKVDPLLALMLPEISGSEEDNIAEIVEKLTAAGRIVADYYCTNGDQIVYELMRQLANYTSSKAISYVKEGLLDPSYYVNLADAFNPACPITHFPQD